MFVMLGKEGFCNVEILNIIYLIPFFICDRQRLQFSIVKHADHAKHLLVILVITD